MGNTSIIVVGGLNTDIFVSGISAFPQPGGYVVGKQLHIGAGGKSRNIAEMIAALVPPKSVALIGRTTKDLCGLWRPAYKTLQAAGVNTKFIVFSEQAPGSFPGVALIPVDQRGNNQIYLAPGVNNDFSSSDIDAADSLFDVAAKGPGLLALSLECPIPTAMYAIRKANAKGLKVVLDPGGIQPDTDIKQLLSSSIFAIKPNEYEATILTGIQVKDLNSAQLAGQRLISSGIANVLITAGKNGAYLINESTTKHLSPPNIESKTDKNTDETGCGDQAMAALCASLSEGRAVYEAAQRAVLAGTLQFRKEGIQPLSKEDFSAAVSTILES